MQKTLLTLAVAALVIGVTVTYYKPRAQADKISPISKEQKMTIKREPSLPACNIGAMTPAQRQRHDQIGKQLCKAVKQVKELPSGYAFRYAHDPAMFMAAAEFISLESQCCSFYKFSLEKEQGEGPIWLRVSGPKETKHFIKAVLAP